MKRMRALTCGPSIKIANFPYVVVQTAGKKVENSAFGKQCLPPSLPPFSYSVLTQIGCHRELFYVVLKVGSICFPLVPWTDTKYFCLDILS